MADFLKYLESKKNLINKAMEEFFPRKLSKEDLERIFGKPSYSYNTEALNKSLAEPIWDFLDRGGKRWRPALFLLFVEALGGDSRDSRRFLPILEMLHEGSIIVDDIEDSSEFRRGKPALHKIYGTDIAINAGNFLYFLPFVVLIEDGKCDEETRLRLWNSSIQELIRIHAGQGSDIAWHNGLDHSENLGPDEYLQMCAYKTGVLSRLAARLAVILTKGSEELEEKLGRLGESMGIAFQIQDDILNLKPSKDWGKDYGDDINEGKITLIVIHTLKHSSRKDRERLLEILKMHTEDRNLIKEAVEIMERNGSLDYAKGYARKIMKDVWEGVDPLIEESRAKKRLKEFVDFLVEREI